MSNPDAALVYGDLLWQDPDRMSGALCFYGTRIPVSFLFDYIAQGRTVEEFSKDYRVELERARRVMSLALDSLSSLLREAA
jgi:uncharacterized protein (DUF433 family)